MDLQHAARDDESRLPNRDPAGCGGDPTRNTHLRKHGTDWILATGHVFLENCLGRSTGSPC